MFEPRFTISNKMMEWVVVVEKTKLLLDLVKLSDDWETRMKQDALGRRVVATMRQSGASLGVVDVVKIMVDDPSRDDKADEVAVRAGVVGRETDIQMAINWMNTNKYKEQMVYLAQKFHQKNLGIKELCQINSLWLERLVEPSVAGRLRNELADEQNEIDNVPGQVLSIEVPHQVEDLLMWLNSQGRKSIHPLLVGGIVLYEILRIKPFGEGNLAEAMFVMNWVLEEDGYGMKSLWEAEDEILKNRDSIWGQVESVKANDLTGWLEFYLRGLAEAAEKLKTRVMLTIGETPVFKTDSGKRVALSERQILIMESLTIGGETTIKQVRALLPTVSDDTILRDLKDLMEKRLVKKKGRTKGAVYVLGKSRSFGS